MYIIISLLSDHWVKIRTRSWNITLMMRVCRAAGVIAFDVGIYARGECEREEKWRAQHYTME